MRSPAAAERAELCDLFLTRGPDAPTLAGTWTTRDLSAHLVVRERRPDAGLGIVTRFLASHSEQVRVDEAKRPYAEIVERVRKGPPHWSPMRVEAVDRMVNSIEFFVHHEDVRRAERPWSPRPLAVDLEDTLASLIVRAARFFMRSLPVQVVVEFAGRPPRVVHSGQRGAPTVAVRGPTGECVLFLYGRGAVADVQLDGPEDAVAALRSAPLGI